MRQCRQGHVVAELQWDAVVEVAILTNDRGPEEMDVFFELVGRGGQQLTVDHATAVQHRLLQRIERLPDFEFESLRTVAVAMGSTENARFVCWRRH